jgi:hypothetical protein
MKVLILEACRSPEIDKGLTEPLILSKLFTNNNIEYELYSNDGIWTNQVQIDEALIRNRLKESSINIVHFAVHGGVQGLILKWSNDAYVGHRVPVSFLTGSGIRLIEEFQGKLIVSGACASAQFADDFLAAGADAVVAPLTEISWSKLGLFFKIFYLSYRSSKSVKDALNKAVEEFPQYNCYHVFQN